MKRTSLHLLVCVLLLLVAPASSAQFLQYMDFPAGTMQGDTLNLPLTLNLPCYGRVLVTIAPNPPTDPVPLVTFFHQTAAENQSPQNAPQFSWGTDTDRFNVFANAGPLDYTITFTFLDGPPDTSRLILIVAGLASATTGTITTIPPSAPGTLLGEFRFPTPSSTTVLTGNVLSSANDGDPINTGWALYRPQGVALTSVSVRMNQAAGDGLGWTLSYLCAPAVVEPIPTATLPTLLLLAGLLAVVALKVLR